MKLMTVTEYAMEENGIEKNASNISCRDHEGLFFGDFAFELNFEVDLSTDSAN